MLSYRSDDAPGHAGRLFDRLHAHFTNRSVHIDVPQVAPGEDFITATEKAIAECGALIVIIGPDWLTSVDRNGRRLSDADDIIRLQISIALTRGGWVVPALVKGATVPRADALPEDIGALSRRQGAELRDTRWDADVDDLIAAIEKGLALADDTSTANRWRRLLLIWRVALATLVAGGVIAGTAVLQPTSLPDLPWRGTSPPRVDHGAAELDIGGIS